MMHEGLRLAYSSWDSEEYDALQEVITAGQFSMGERVLNFEQMFASFIGSRYAVMVNSGSSANLLMIASLFYKHDHRLKLGDEVIVPAVSWSTTYFPLYQYGLRLKFVDIDLDTLNYDIACLREAVTSETKLIVAVNLLGNPNDFSAIADIIGQNDIILVEDNCESMGATFDSKFTGTFGLLGTFSTYFSHHISTMEGGVIITDDEELYHILLSLRSHGWTRQLPRHNFVSGSKSSDVFEESFKFVLPGYNVRPLEMSGALGITQLRKLPEIIKNRRLNAMFFCDLLADHPDLMIQTEIGESSWFGFSLIIRKGSSLTLAKLRSCLDLLNVEYRPIVAGNFTKNPVCNFFTYKTHGNLPNANHLDQHGLFIGNNGQDNREQLLALAKL